MNPHLFRNSAWVLFALLLLPSCQTLQQVAALRDVDFAIDGVTDTQLAGLDLTQIRSYSDLGARDVLNLTRAVASREMPLQFNVQIEAANPAENPVTARLVQLDWMLLLEGEETISGVFNGDVALPPGQPQIVPFAVELDLFQFFDKNARDLVDLALAVSGQGGAPKEIQLRATPTINTAIGPIRYPNPITIVSREVGN